jgi:hypothetical protein
MAALAGAAGTLVVSETLLPANALNLPTNVKILTLDTITQTVPFTGLNGVTTLNLKVGVTSVFALPALTDLIVENAADPVNITALNFSDTTGIEHITFKEAIAHRVASQAFINCTALEDVTFDTGATKVIISNNNSFPVVAEFDAEDDFFGSLRTAYANGAGAGDTGVAGKYELDLEKGWKK